MVEHPSFPEITLVRDDPRSPELTRDDPPAGGLRRYHLRELAISPHISPHGRSPEIWPLVGRYGRRREGSMPTHVLPVDRESLFRS